MTELRQLPRRGHWEVDVIETPEVRVKDVVLRGTLIIADRDTALVLGAAPIVADEEIGPHVLRAASAPAEPNTPARPRSIRCRSDLRGELFDAARALDAKLTVQTHLPAIEDVCASMRHHFDDTGPPFLPTEPAPWKALFADLVRAKPWMALDDGVCFRYPSGSAILEDAVGLVLGMAGEQLGFVLYPTSEDHERFMEAVYDGDIGAMLEVDVWCAHIDPVADLPPDHVALAKAQGLVHDGRALHLFAVEPDGSRPLEPHEEVACLAALQGMLGAWHTHGVALLEHWPTTSVETAAGRLMVELAPASIDEPEGVIFDVDHQIIFTAIILDGRKVPALVLKMAKRDAVRLAREIDDVDALSLDDSGDGSYDVVAWSGSDCVGVLTEIPAARQHWEDWRDGGALVISAGGAKRRTLQPQDAVLTLEVHLLDDELPAAENMLYGDDSLDGANWDGPPEEWPKASTVLLAFASPLGIAEMPREVMEKAIGFAATVWSAVVSADEAAKPELLNELSDGLAGSEVEPVLEFLIARKRTAFAQDRRIMMVDHFKRSPGRVDVEVAWHMP